MWPQKPKRRQNANGVTLGFICNVKAYLAGCRGRRFESTWVRCALLLFKPCALGGSVDRVEEGVHRELYEVGDVYAGSLNP